MERHKLEISVLTLQQDQEILKLKPLQKEWEKFSHKLTLLLKVCSVQVKAEEGKETRACGCIRTLSTGGNDSWVDQKLYSLFACISSIQLLLLVSLVACEQLYDY